VLREEAKMGGLSPRECNSARHATVVGVTLKTIISGRQTDRAVLDATLMHR
jgi:hypothetical protein